MHSISFIICAGITHPVEQAQDSFAELLRMDNEVFIH